MKSKILFTILGVCMSLFVRANNVQITNISASGNNISFNLSWENSWNSTNNIDTLYPQNWDAVWLFVKVQSNTDNLWKRQLLSTTAAAHTATHAVPLTVEATTDGLGIFLRRTNAGSGNISNVAVTLQMQTLPSGTLNFKVFGVEMVHIPSGSFNVGDGVATSASEVRFYDSTITVNAETNGYTGGKLYSGSPAVPALFPLGYDAMYAMKYEITYEQMADFLNTLTYDQQANHIDVAPNSPTGTAVFAGTAGVSTHLYLRIQDTGTNNTKPAVIGCDYNNDGVFNDLQDGLTVACPMFTYKNFYAYLDWSGLRPMTETEFEKMCRGSRFTGNPVARVANEYVWGTIDLATYNHGSTGMTDINLPTARLVTTPLNGRIAGHGGAIPLRSGIFAESATGRATAGAGFYGNMDLGGNVCETVVCVNAAGATYTAQPGDGILDVNAEANQSTWPAVGGLGYRGSFYGATTAPASGNSPSYYTRQAKTSQRAYCPYTPPARPYFLGGRGVR